MQDFSVVLITVNRSPQQNYLRETLGNLVRSGLFSSPRVYEFAIYDSGTNERPYGWACDERDKALDAYPLYRKFIGEVYGHEHQVCANLNTAAALAHGATSRSGWVLFLEDDIDVCADFFDGVGDWLDEHAVDGPMVYDFSSPHYISGEPEAIAAGALRYPRKNFFGTQAVAFRSRDAAELAEFIRDHVYDFNPEGTCYDLLMQRWLAGCGVEEVLSSAPSYVEHTGRESVINPRADVHRCPSWPGRDWSPIKKAVTA